MFHLGLVSFSHLLWCFEACPYYLLWSSGASLKWGALIHVVRYSQNKEWMSFVFYCFENPSIAHNLGTTGPIQVGFSAKCTSLNKHFNQMRTENVTFDFRLISLDCNRCASSWFCLFIWSCGVVVVVIFQYFSSNFKFVE